MIHDDPTDPHIPVYRDDPTEVIQTSQVQAPKADTRGMTLRKAFIVADLALVAALFIGGASFAAYNVANASAQNTTTTTVAPTTTTSTTVTTTVPTTKPKPTKSTTTTAKPKVTDTTTPNMPPEPTEQQKNIPPASTTTVPEDDDIGRQPWSVPPTTVGCEQTFSDDGSSMNTRKGTHGQTPC